MVNLLFICWNKCCDGAYFPGEDLTFQGEDGKLIVGWLRARSSVEQDKPGNHQKGLVSKHQGGEKMVKNMSLSGLRTVLLVAIGWVCFFGSLLVKDSAICIPLLVIARFLP